MKTTHEQLSAANCETDIFQGSRKFSRGTSHLCCRIFAFCKGSPKGSSSSKVPQKVPREPFPRISQYLSELLFSSKKQRIRRKPRPCINAFPAHFCLFTSLELRPGSVAKLSRAERTINHTTQGRSKNEARIRNLFCHSSEGQF